MQVKDLKQLLETLEETAEVSVVTHDRYQVTHEITLSYDAEILEECNELQLIAALGDGKYVVEED